MLVRKIIFIILASVSLAAACIFASRTYADYRIAMVKTVVAAKDIPPRTEITEEHLVEISIPENYLMNASLTKEEVIGKYTDIQGMIPAGSPIYASMVHEPSTLPDHPELQLKEGQAVYTLETDLSGAGSIASGQRVDVHLSLELENETPLTGNILNHARVIAIKDHQGMSLDDPGSTGVPFLILLAVKREDVDLLNMAEMTGEIRLFASSSSYDTEQEAERVTDSQVYAYLQTLLSQENTTATNETQSE